MKNLSAVLIGHISHHMSKMRLGILCAALSLCFVSTTEAASGPGDVVGKVSVGYQGWFACAGDGSPNNNWTHWGNTWQNIPSPSNYAPPLWPDVRDYATTYQTGFPNLNNGQSATLFSSDDQQVINTHMLWMQQNGIDTVALQRFGGGNTDDVAAKVRIGAEAYGRKFYLMYDMNGFNTIAGFQNDWNSKGAAFTSSPAYAKQNGKPVVCIWGIGMGFMTQAQDLQIINWFQSQGCYVIGGVSWNWYSQTANAPSYNALNMISPWMVGVVGNIAGADNLYTNYLVPEEAYCNSHGIDYQPCVLPGDMSQNERLHGDLMWEMFYNAVRASCQGIYISMFDEYGEGNQIIKTSTDSSGIPQGTDFLSSNGDGTWCTSDYYLRLTGDGGKMLKGQIALTSIRPTQPNPSQIIPNGTYSIISRNSGKALEVYGQSTADGSTVDQWDDNGGANQLWSVTYMGNNQYEIVEIQSVKALEVYAQSTADGAPVDIWSVNGGSNQLWTITPASGGYCIITNANSRKPLDVYAGSLSDGGSVDQWTSDGGSNQQWAFQTPVPTQTVPNGNYAIVSANSGKVLDVYGGSTTDGSTIDQWDKLGGSNQLWSVTYAGDNQYQIVGVQSAKSLEVYGQSTSVGAKVDIWDINGGTNQLWTLTPTTGGNYNIVNVNSGLLLDVYGASNADGAAIDQWTSGGGSNQQWTFQTP